MLPEVLVVFACLNSTGCNETSNAVYQTHPEIQEMAKTVERKAKDFIGPVIVETIAPFWFVAAGGSGSVKIYGGFSVEVHKFNNPTFMYSKDF